MGMIFDIILDIDIHNDMNINIHIDINMNCYHTPSRHPLPPPGPVCGRPRHGVGGGGWGDIKIHIDRIFIDILLL